MNSIVFTTHSFDLVGFLPFPQKFETWTKPFCYPAV